MTDLRIGGHYDGATPQLETGASRFDKDGREVEAFRVQAWDRSTRSTNSIPAPFGPNDTPENILRPVQQDIDRKTRALNESNGFDARTGEPNWVIRGERRAILERELQHLTHFTYPIAQQQAKAAAEWHASQPTKAEKLQEEADRRASIQMRALSIADQLEAEKEAERILRARRQGG